MIKQRSALLRAHSRGSFARLVLESEMCNGPRLPSASRKPVSLLYHFLQCVVIFLRFITPASYLLVFGTLIHAIITYAFNWGYQFNVEVFLPSWLAAVLFVFDSQRLFQLSYPMSTILFLYAIAEVLFFPYYYYLFTQIAHVNDDLQHHAQDRAGRMQLVRDCLEALALSTKNSPLTPQEYIRKTIEGWFLDHPLHTIHYGNFFAWTAWAYFGKDPKEMDLEETQENREIVAYFESMAGWSFPPGFNTDVPPLRLNLDPVFVTQRPLLCYLVVFVINTFFHLFLRFVLGFRYDPEHSASDGSQNIYLRPARKRRGIPEETPDKLPVIFVHGIGCGFAMYVTLIVMLPTDTDVYLVEWPYVSMQMTMMSPRAEEAAAAVLGALAARGHTQCCVMAHSLGTVLVSWLCRAHSARHYYNTTHPEDSEVIRNNRRSNSIDSSNNLHLQTSNIRSHDSINSLGSRRNTSTGEGVVAATILLDPVVFLLFDPTVASVFVYRDPKDSIDLLMHYFLSRELFISNALSRHFAWSYNVLFPEDLMTHRACCDELRRNRRRDKWSTMQYCLTSPPKKPRNSKHRQQSRMSIQSTQQQQVNESILHDTTDWVHIDEQQHQQLNHHIDHYSSRSNDAYDAYQASTTVLRSGKKISRTINQSMTPQRSRPTTPALSSTNDVVDGYGNRRGTVQPTNSSSGYSSGNGSRLGSRATSPMPSAMRSNHGSNAHMLYSLSSHFSNPLATDLNQSSHAVQDGLYFQQHPDSIAEEAVWMTHLHEAHGYRNVAHPDPLPDASTCTSIDPTCDTSSTVSIPRHTVVLSTDDGIVPVPQVTRYLSAKIASGAVASMEVKVAHGPHGVVLLHPQWLRTLYKCLRDKIDHIRPTPHLALDAKYAHLTVKGK